jgi:hypothetical protein
LRTRNARIKASFVAAAPCHVLQEICGRNY